MINSTVTCTDDSVSRQYRPWPYSADMQANICMRCSHTPQRLYLYSAIALAFHNTNLHFVCYQYPNLSLMELPKYVVLA